MGKTFSNKVEAGAAFAGFVAEGRCKTFGFNPGFVADVSAMQSAAHSFVAKQGAGPSVNPTAGA